MTQSKARLSLFMLLLVWAELLLPSLAFSADDTLVMGIFPRRNAANTIMLFKPMAEYLSLQLGRKVKLVTARDFPSFWKGVAERKFDLVHYNQYHYVKSHDAYGYEVILKNEEFGESTIRSSLLVRKDSGIMKIQDLKGKRILFGGDHKAMMSYVVPTLLLRRAGLMAGDYTELFAKNPPNACIGVFHKHADAAGTGDIVTQLPVVRNKIDIAKLTHLAVSEKLEHLPWAVKANMDPILKNKIQYVLSTLSNSNKGKSILKQAKLTNLLLISDDKYDTHRQLIGELEDQLHSNHE